MEAVHVQLADEARELRGAGVSGTDTRQGTAEETDVVVLEVGAEDGAAELAHIGYDEARAGRMWERAKKGERRSGTDLVPSSVQVMNCEDFGSLIILRAYVMWGQQAQE